MTNQSGKDLVNRREETVLALICAVVLLSGAYKIWQEYNLLKQEDQERAVRMTGTSQGGELSCGVYPCLVPSYAPPQD